MTDKSFGDHSNRSYVKNPLLSTAVTGFTFEELAQTAVILPAQAALKAENTSETNKDLSSGDATARVTHVDPNETKSANKSRSRDDFDVSEYYARLQQGSRYVSAPITARIQDGPSAAGLQADESLEEINLNEADSNTNSITADIAQNFTQLPQVLPQIANSVFNSFSNILNRMNKDQVEDQVDLVDGADGIVGGTGVVATQIGDGGTAAAACDPVPMFASVSFGETQSGDVGKPPVGAGGSNTFRITSKKKYAQIPGLRTGDLSVPPPTISNPSAPQAIQSSTVETKADLFIPPPTMFSNENAPKETTRVSSAISETNKMEINASNQLKHEINLANHYPDIGPPPTAGGFERKHIGSANRNLLPPSVARRMSATQAPPSEIQPNIFVPQSLETVRSANFDTHEIRADESILNAPNTGSFNPNNFDSSGDGISISQSVLLKDDAQMRTENISVAAPPSTERTAIITPSTMANMSSQESSQTLNSKRQAIEQKPLPKVFNSNLTELDINATEQSGNIIKQALSSTSTRIESTTNNITAPCELFDPTAHPKEKSAFPSADAPVVPQMYFEPSAQNPDSQAALTHPPEPSRSAQSLDASVTAQPTFFHPISQVSQTKPITLVGPAADSFPIAPPMFLNPSAQSSISATANLNLASSAAFPPMHFNLSTLPEPPKAVSGVNYRLTNKKRPQYYSGPIDGGITATSAPFLPPPNDLVAPVQPVINAETYSYPQPGIYSQTKPFNYPHIGSIGSNQGDVTSTVEDKASAIFDSLKSKLSSVKLNKIQDVVTSFFDPNYYESSNSGEPSESIKYDQTSTNITFGGVSAYDSSIQTQQDNYYNTPNYQVSNSKQAYNPLQGYYDDGNYSANQYGQQTPISTAQHNFYTHSNVNYMYGSAVLQNVPHLCGDNADLNYINSSNLKSDSAGTTCQNSQSYLPFVPQGESTEAIRSDSDHGFIQTNNESQLSNQYSNTTMREKRTIATDSVAGQGDQTRSLKHDARNFFHNKDLDQLNLFHSGDSSMFGNRGVVTADSVGLTEEKNSNLFENSATSEIKQNISDLSAKDFYEQSAQTIKDFESENPSINLYERRDSYLGHSSSASYFDNTLISSSEDDTSKNISKFHDLTEQLIQNITSPIQCFNPVEKPLQEFAMSSQSDEYDEDQAKLIEQIAEETVTSISRATSEKELHNITKQHGVVHETNNYGFIGLDEEGPNDRDYNSSGIGLYDNVSLPNNASDEIKAVVLQGTVNDNINEQLLPRQLTCPSAPSLEVLEAETSREDNDRSDSLDIQQIEADAKRDSFNIDEFTIEPSETDDDKLESFKDRSSDEKEISERVYSLFGETPSSGASQIIHFNQNEETNTPVSYACYFDTGNYAADNYYKNITSQPPEIVSSTSGHEESNQDITKQQEALIESVQKMILEDNVHSMNTPDTHSDPPSGDKLNDIDETLEIHAKDSNNTSNLREINDPSAFFEKQQSLTTQESNSFISNLNISTSIEKIDNVVEGNESKIIEGVTSNYTDATKYVPPSFFTTQQDEIKESFIQNRETLSSNAQSSFSSVPTRLFTSHRDVSNESRPSVTISHDDRSPLNANLPSSIDDFKDSNYLVSNNTLTCSVQSKDDNISSKTIDVPISSSNISSNQIEFDSNPGISFFETQNTSSNDNKTIVENETESNLSNTFIQSQDNASNNLLASYFSTSVADEFNITPKSIVQASKNEPLSQNADHAKQFFQLSESQNHYKFDLTEIDDNAAIYDDHIESFDVCVTDARTIKHCPKCYKYFKSATSKMSCGDAENAPTSVSGTGKDVPGVSSEASCSGLAGASKKGVRINLDNDEYDESRKDDNSSEESEYGPLVYHWYYKVQSENKTIWRPFSYVDTQSLERAFKAGALNDPIAVHGGRYDVILETRSKKPVYWEGVPSEVRRCSWFFKNTSDPRYTPYTEETAQILEEEFQRGLQTKEWHRKITLSNGDNVVLHGPTVMVHFSKATLPGTGSGRPNVVKRWIDDLDVEESETTLIDHLLLMVHGIGSACDLRFRPVEEVVDDFRSISLQLIQAHYKSSYDSETIGRVEVLPISWHASLHAGGVDDQLSLITLESIPKFRSFTNDTVLDVLFYSSPVFCQTIVNTVANEMNRIVSLFRSRNPSFNGRVSIGGHSLGSLITFDLLMHQADDGVTKSPAHSQDRLKYVAGLAGTGQPSIVYPKLLFRPQALFALGSPIGMFTCVRGCERLGVDFTLPTCKAFYNIFHPYDPIAYRMEPLINPTLKHLTPSLIPHHKGRKRMHLELKETMARVGADIRTKVMDSIKNTWSSVFKPSLEEVLNEELSHDRCETRSQHQQPASSATAEQCKQNSQQDQQQPLPEVSVEMFGSLNGGRRVDYVLQEAPFELINEYIFAMTSHVCYWDSEDTILLMLKEIYQELGVSSDTTVPAQTMSVEVERRVNSPQGEGRS